MEKIATDIYTFSELRGGGYVYVDKTDILHRLACGDIGKTFFIARPRRFGKSLAVSTLRSLFEGRRDLFAGLAIEPLWDWSKKWPVLHLDMGSAQADTVDELRARWRRLLANECRRNGIEFRDDGNPATAFENTIYDLAAKSPDGKAVVLIDEYDKPLLNHLCKPDAIAFRDAMKQFYSVVKTLESFQRFTFLTGVSKFSKVSVFSDLNNLIDVTTDARTATLFGYTHGEVKKYFPGLIHALAEAHGMTDAEAFGEIINWYDGYRFDESAELVINPVSLGLCLGKRRFANYWSQTAMPTFLTEILKRRPLDFSSIDIDEETLGAYEPDRPNITTLLYQTGYLTIKGASRIGVMQRYDLGFPNLEVENSFLRDLSGIYAGLEPVAASSLVANAARALYAHDVPKFLSALKSFFAQIPYDMTDRQNEQMWQTIVYVVLRSIGVNVNGEVKTNDGRIDMVVETPSDAYVVEFKLDRPASEAIAQIREKGYADRFAASGKRTTLVGISFSSEKRTIVGELVEEL